MRGRVGGTLLRVLTVGPVVGRLTGRSIGVLAVKEGPAHFEPLADLCVAGDVKIHIDRVFTLDEVPAALAHVGEGLRAREGRRPSRLARCVETHQRATGMMGTVGPGSEGSGRGQAMATLLSVNVGMPKDVSWRGRTVHTGVWKSPVSGPQMVRRLNIDGDGQGDLAGHGGEIRAVLVYQIESYRHWQEFLDRDDLEHGAFGENFTVEGLG